MDWFEEWFDSPLYEKLYADRDEEEAARLIEFIEKILPLQKGDTILDLGCGRGRHSVTLSQKGYDVTGIDLSKRAIGRARERARSLNLECIRFEVRDMRRPLAERFDAVFNLFTTFGYFDTDAENARVFDSVRQMLRPGGWYVFDYLNAARVRRSVRPFDEGTFHGIHYDIRRYIENNAVHKKIIFSGEQLDHDKEYTERVKLYELPWFREQLTKRGFEINRVYGDYRGNEFDPDKSDRLLIICRWEPKGRSKK